MFPQPANLPGAWCPTAWGMLKNPGATSQVLLSLSKDDSQGQASHRSWFDRLTMTYCFRGRQTPARRLFPPSAIGRLAIAGPAGFIVPSKRVLRGSIDRE